MKRNKAMRTGAASPMWAYVGRQPISTVGTVIISTLINSVRRRPLVSPAVPHGSVRRLCVRGLVVDKGHQEMTVVIAVSWKGRQAMQEQGHVGNGELRVLHTCGHLHPYCWCVRHTYMPKRDGSKRSGQEPNCIYCPKRQISRHRVFGREEQVSDGDTQL